MSKSNASKSSKTLSDGKPAKPYVDFPLYAHGCGQWAKKIRGKTRFFGKWRNEPYERSWKDALARYQAEIDDLQAGRDPRLRQAGCTIRDLCNEFLRHKKQLVQTGEITQRTWDDYKRDTDRLVSVLDPAGDGQTVESLTFDDFARLRRVMAETMNPTTLHGAIIRVRSIFKFAYEAELIEKPVRYGVSFDTPRKAVIRKALNASGAKDFTAEQLREIIEAAPTATLRAMILIAAQSGMGNHDVGLLTFEAVDLERGWINFPRSKTGAQRRFPLWPETVDAIKESLESRPIPRPGNEQYVFLTRKREKWSKDNTRGVLSREFKKILESVGITRKGAGFYDLRRTFQTVAEEAGETATKFIMGHLDESMSARYRQRISDERLQAVVDHVRAWLSPLSE